MKTSDADEDKKAELNDPLWKGNPPRNRDGLTWKEYVDKVTGSWEGEFPERDQGEYPIRDEL